MKVLENTTFDQISRQLNGLEANNQTCDDQSGLLSYRLEMYSCKMTAPERKEYKAIAAKLGQNPTKVHSALAPPQLSSSPFGSGTEPPPLVPNENTRIISLDEHGNCINTTNNNNKNTVQNDSNLSLSSMGDDSDENQEKTTTQEHYTYTASQKTLFHLRSCMTSSFAPDYDFSNTSADEFSREPNLAWVKNHIKQTLMTTLRDNCDSNLIDSMWIAIDEAVKLDEAIVYSYNPQIAGEDDPFSSCLWGFAFLFFNHKLNRLVLVSCSSEMIEDENDRLMFSSDFDDEERLVNDLEVEYYEEEDIDKTAKAIANNMLRRGFSRQRSESTGQKYKEIIEKERYGEVEKEEKEEDQPEKFRRRTNTSESKLFRSKDKPTTSNDQTSSFLSSFNSKNNTEMQITFQMN